MGFGEDLRCPQAHAAVLRLLDSELHLMEVMKKWMGQRAKSEREFSAQLHQMTAMAEKMERPQSSAGLDYISQLNKVSSFHQQREGYKIRASRSSDSVCQKGPKYPRCQRSGLKKNMFLPVVSLFYSFKVPPLLHNRGCCIFLIFQMHRISNQHVFMNYSKTLSKH